MSDAVSARAEVFIATSLDGFIARPNGDIAWLTGLPVPEGEDFGYAAFMDGIGAIVMGRASYEKALTFDRWPYAVPVVVMSRNPEKIVVPEALKGRVRITAVPPDQLLAVLTSEGVRRVYVDGGQVIRDFLSRGLISRLIVTQVPVLLGEGLALFGHGPGGDIPARLVASRHWPNGFVQSEYALG